MPELRANASEGLRLSVGTRPDAVNPKGPPLVVLQVGLESMLLILGALWVLWERWVRPTLQKKLVGVWAPIEEEKRLTNIIGAMVVLCEADRGILCAFHNGVIDDEGYHFHKMTAINQWVRPDATSMPHPIRDLPIGRIMLELLEMRETMYWTKITRHRDLPALCKQHLTRNQIFYMSNRLVMVGNVEIGIVSMQYTSHRRRYFEIERSPQKLQLLDKYYDEIAQIMQRRVVRPPLLTRAKLLLSRVIDLRARMRPGS